MGVLLCYATIRSEKVCCIVDEMIYTDKIHIGACDM